MSKITIPIPGAPVVIASDRTGVTVTVDGVVVARTTTPAPQVEQEVRQQIQREEDRQLSIAETDRIIKELSRKKSSSALMGNFPGDEDEDSGPLPRPPGPGDFGRLRIIKRR